jgi:hypothetical protein
VSEDSRPLNNTNAQEKTPTRKDGAPEVPQVAKAPPVPEVPPVPETPRLGTRTTRRARQR